jgi:serine protease Do
MKCNVVCGMAILAVALATPGAFAQQRAQARSTQAMTPSSPYLGIGVRDVDSDSAKKYSLKDVRGAEITSVTEESPAAKAGFKEGDVVLEFNGQPVEGGEQLSRMVRETPIGRQVRIGVWRNGSMQTLTATVESRKGPTARVFTNDGNGWVTPMPEMQGMEQLRNFRMPEFDMPGFSNVSRSMLGIMGESLGQQEQLAEFFGVKEGVLVKSVNRNSPAEKAGIKAGDVIVKVDDTSVNTSGDITNVLRQSHSKKTFTVVVVRNKKETPLTVTIDNANNLTGSPVRAGMIVGPGFIQVGPPVEIPRMAIPRMAIRIPTLVFAGEDRVI